MALIEGSELHRKMQSKHDDEIEQTLEKAQRTIGYRFKDKFILWEALQCGAALPDLWVCRFKDKPRSQHGNKGLALIGDALLRQLLVCVMVSTGHAPEAVQDMIALKVSNENLAETGRQHGLDVLIDRGTKQVQPVGRKAVADTVEAIIGAVHQDSDHNEKVVAGVMRTLGIWPSGLVG